MHVLGSSHTCLCVREQSYICVLGVIHVCVSGHTCVYFASFYDFGTMYSICCVF